MGKFQVKMIKFQMKMGKFQVKMEKFQVEMAKFQVKIVKISSKNDQILSNLATFSENLRNLKLYYILSKNGFQQPNLIVVENCMYSLK